MRTQSAAAGGRVVTLTANPSLDRTLDLPGPAGAGLGDPAGRQPHRARGQGRQRLPGDRRRRGRRRVGAARRRRRPDRPGAARPRAAAGHRADRRPGAHQLHAHRARRDDDQAQRARRPAGPAARWPRWRPCCTSTRPARGGSCCPARCRPGAPADWYATLVRSLRSTGARIAVDTSEAPLLALLAAGPAAAPDLLKPNTEELAQLAGVTEESITDDPDAALAAVARLHERGVAEVLLTLGGDGAVLSTADGGLWSARPPRTTVRSTVGAGDSSLAGYVLADLAGADAGRTGCAPPWPTGRPAPACRAPPSPPRPRPTPRRSPSPPAWRPSAPPRPPSLPPRPPRPPVPTPAENPRENPMPALITTDLVALDADLGPRQGRRRPPARRSGRRRRPRDRRRRPARRRHGPGGQGGHRPARRHRHPALPVRRGHPGVAGLRPARPEGRLRRARTARRTSSS